MEIEVIEETEVIEEIDIVIEIEIEIFAGIETVIVEIDIKEKKVKAKVEVEAMIKRENTGNEALQIQAVADLWLKMNKLNIKIIFYLYITMITKKRRKVISKNRA